MYAGVTLDSTETPFAKTPFSWFLILSHVNILSDRDGGGVAKLQNFQEPLNAPFLKKGLFSSGFSRGKTAH